MKVVKNVNQYYRNYILKNIPKVLTQVDRDCHSKTYGSCDRNYWHLKIRDFSSAILQQTGLTMAILYKTDFDGNVFYQNSDVAEWAKATVYFWEKIQLKDGSFNEYYPNEHGFPPTAFSLYSACEIYKRLDMCDDNLIKAFNKTAKYLVNHIEENAYNQEMASITALYSLYSITKEEWVLKGLNHKLERILSLQSDEGWFAEYGGADIGYLSVSLDMLAEYYFLSKDERAYEPINKMISFIKYFVHPDGTIGGEYGSRNTTYFLPNGLEVMAQLGNEDAVAIKNYIYINDQDNFFFLDAVDDRYCSHYLMHSFLRALEKEVDTKPTVSKLPHQFDNDKYFEQAGLYTYKKNNFFMIAGLQKGGIIKSYIDNREVFIDCGYRVNYGKGKVAAMNWQDASYDIKRTNEGFEVSGNFNVVSTKIPSPFMNFGLRVCAKLFGRKLISVLKKMIILVNNHNDIKFTRKISITNDSLIVTDNITSPECIDLLSANNFSLRHVASGKFYSVSDITNRSNDSYIKIKQIEIKKVLNLNTEKLDVTATVTQ